MNAFDDIRDALIMLQGLMQDRSRLTPAKREKQHLSVYPDLVRGWRFLAGDAPDNPSQLFDVIARHIETLLGDRVEAKEARGPSKHLAAIDATLEARIASGEKLKRVARDAFKSEQETHQRRLQRHRQQARERARTDELERIELQSPENRGATLDPPEFLAHI